MYQSQGPDGSHQRIIVKTGFTIACPLKIIFEDTINIKQLQVFLQYVKKAKKSELPNYGPISLISMQSYGKVCQRLHITSLLTYRKLFHQ